MKISIIGTRGIPNNYGGFEQFSEHLAQNLVKRGHDVTVYNSHSHPFQKPTWNGVNIIHKRDPEDRLGTIGQFIYDFNCIVDLKNHDFDIILQLGYTSSSIWNKLLPSNSKIITNMDGLEWKRSKFNKPTQMFLKYAEKLAANSSDILIADSIGIQEHLQKTYSLPSTYIPYGATVFDTPNLEILNEFDLEPENYNLLVARMEPENNIETIINGHNQSNTKLKLILIGKIDNDFGQYLKTHYANEQIVFIGGVYNQNKLNNLRYFSHIYFHGHSVGGTNPSLLEAMASNSLICAHNNIFNKSILGQNAYYFNDSLQIASIINSLSQKSFDKEKLNNNRQEIITNYSWESIVTQYETLFVNSLINA